MATAVAMAVIMSLNIVRHLGCLPSAVVRGLGADSIPDSTQQQDERDTGSAVVAYAVTISRMDEGQGTQVLLDSIEVGHSTSGGTGAVFIMLCACMYCRLPANTARACMATLDSLVLTFDRRRVESSVG
jgi:hypothetical protein